MVEVNLKVDVNAVGGCFVLIILYLEYMTVPNSPLLPIPFPPCVAPTKKKEESDGRTSTQPKLSSRVGTSPFPWRQGSPSPPDRTSPRKIVQISAHANICPLSSPSPAQQPSIAPAAHSSSVCGGEKVFPSLGCLLVPPVLIVFPLLKCLRYVAIGACPHFSR